MKQFESLLNYVIASMFIITSNALFIDDIIEHPKASGNHILLMLAISVLLMSFGIGIIISESKMESKE